MASVNELLRLCRLCLVKDEVHIPIFDEQGDIRQIFLKISACLPVKVSREDNLPKNICDSCSSKLESLYQFWNTSANSEKKLIQWLSAERTERNAQHSMIDPVILKQEVVEVPDERTSPDHLDDLNVSNDADYLQQQLPYENVEFQFQQDDYEETVTDSVVEVGSVSRKRRAAAIRAIANMGSEDEGNPDLLEPKLAKIEEESEESGGEDPEPTAFVGLPSATDNDQPGPSGVCKQSADAPHEVRRAASSGHTYAVCQKTYSSNGGLRAHKSRRHKAKLKHPCKMCGKLFRYEGEARNHESVHRTGERFECDLCRKSFKHERLLRAHLRFLHGGDCKYKCEECGKVCTNQTNLSAHQRRAHMDVTFKCPDCEKVYKDENYLKTHRRTHEPNYAPLTWQCHLCSSTLSSKQAFRSHLKTHSKDQQHVCDTCGKRITSLESFKNHLRIHSGEKPFKCNQCDKTFSAKKFLVAHERVHTKEKPYCCDLCPKRFSQRGTLGIHLRLHSGERPYPCTICDKSFVSKTSLNSHCRTHKRVPIA